MAVIAAAVENAGPVAVAAIVVVEAAKFGVPAVLPWQKKRPGKELPHRTGTLGEPAALPFPL